MTSAPTVSVLVTVYNRAQFVGQTLKSILESQFTDFELIVVDDQSTDNSLQIVNELATTDTRIRVVANEQNLGDYGNRMKAASLAAGEYLKYVDSDDLIYPHSLDVMVQSMRRYPDAAVGLAHSMPEDESPYPWLLTPQQAYRKHFLGRGCLSCGPGGAIIRRKLFEQVGGFRKQWGVLSDMDLWLRLAATDPVVLLPPGLVWWRRHEGQEFSKAGAELEYIKRGFELDMLHLDDPACPLSIENRDAAKQIRQHRIARRVVSMGVKQRHPVQALGLYRSAGLSLAKLVSALTHRQ